MRLLIIEQTAHNFTIDKKNIQALVRITLMMGHFPRKLNPAFLLGLTNKKLKKIGDFISKLKSPIPRSDYFNPFLEDGKSEPNATRIICSRDIETHTSGNCMCDSCIKHGIPIQAAMDQLKMGSLYEFII